MEAKLCGAQECFTGSCKPIWASPSGAGFSDSSGWQGRKPPTFLFVASCYLPLFYPLQAELRREKEEETKNAHALAPTSLSQPSLSPRPVFCLAFRPERSQTFESRETEINQSTEPFCPAHPPPAVTQGPGRVLGSPAGKRGPMRPFGRGVRGRGWKGSWPRGPRGSGGTPPQDGSRLAPRPSGESRRRWAPEAAQTARVSAGLAPGPGSGPPPPPPPSPRTGCSPVAATG